MLVFAPVCPYIEFAVSLMDNCLEPKIFFINSSFVKGINFLVVFLAIKHSFKIDGNIPNSPLGN